MLANLLRSSRLTLLFGQADAGKSALLQRELMPLLRANHDLAVLFNTWGEEPLVDLKNSIADALALPTILPHDSLSAILQRLQTQHPNGRLLILLDSFDTHLAQACNQDPGALAFARELQAAMNHPETLAHFFIAVRDEMQAELNTWRSKVRGFGDRWIRIRPWQTVKPTKLPEDETTQLDPRYQTHLSRRPEVPTPARAEVDLYIPLPLTGRELAESAHLAATALPAPSSKRGPWLNWLHRKRG
jgi:hypothetical protein